MNLKDRRACVTGGAKGIGWAVAQALKSHGATVLVTGRDTDALQKAESAGCLTCAADLATDDGMNKTKSTLDDFGKLDILVNNAGIAISESLEKVTESSWHKTLTVNAWAPLALMQHVVPKMAETGKGRIVNLASNAGVSGYNYSSVYCASKHALVGMTRALAVEYAKTGVTINAVCPGWVDTAMAQRAVDNIADKTGRDQNNARSALERMSPQGRMMTPEEVAHAVLMLCADQAQGINGQTIVIDGGAILK